MEAGIRWASCFRSITGEARHASDLELPVDKALQGLLPLGRPVAVMAGICLAAIGQSARAQNDWQFPDPYFGAFQHRQAGTPQAERRYRQEIAPQQPHRLHEQRPPPAHVRPRPRWIRHRAGT
jgi:hypothetical protein